MQQIKWFERTFDFNTTLDSVGLLKKRLAGSPYMLYEAVIHGLEEVCTRKTGGKWSVKEHLGHLSVLEPVWRLRFEDMRSGKSVMETADLNNRATHEADFNKQRLESLCGWFQEQRRETLQLLRSFSAGDLLKKSMHPRLKQQMNSCDLMLFVAEHDLHHFNQIQHLLNYD